MAAPAMGQVIIQTPNGDSARYEQRAQQEQGRQEAQRRARTTIVVRPRRTEKRIETGTMCDVRKIAQGMSRAL
jgi:hypothetical protein